MAVKFANNAQTTVSASVSTSATSISVADASVFPSITGDDYFLATLVDSGDNVEIVKVTAVSSNTLTVARAREGTAARAFASGDKIENRLTAGGLSDLSARTDVNVDTMAANGSTTTLTLSTDPVVEDNTLVYIDGVYQNKDTYSVSGTTLTFSTAPPSGSAVEVMVMVTASGTASSTDYASAAQGATADAALPRSGGAMTGPITTSSTFDGRDVATDGLKLDGIEANADKLPIGSFVLWGSDTIPSGYLLVNGASLSRSTYSDLFAVIGTAFGAADSSHFNLPPTGTFIRITANGSANDPDRANRTASATGGNTGDNVGSFQSDNVGYHRHIGGMKRIHDSADGEYGTISNQGAQYQTLSRFEFTPTPTPNYDLDYTSYSGSDDTRPKNVNFNLIVKYAA